MIFAEAVESWLPLLADPGNMSAALPCRRLSLLELDHLCQLANGHAVLPTVVGKLRKLGEELGWDRLVTSVAGADSKGLVNEILHAATRRIQQQLAFSMALRLQARQLLTALAAANVAAVVIKGPLFADRLYPAAGLRPFGDIDLLVPVSDWDRAGQCMRDLAYQPQDADMKYATGYGEQAWTCPGRPGVIEIHHNLVNSPTLRKRVSVAYHDLQWEHSAAGEPRLSASSLLLIAAVHGAASHGFDKLQHLCDVCQTVRGAAGKLDESWLPEAAQHTGSNLALAMALDLTSRVLCEPACLRLLNRLRLPWPRLLARACVSPTMVVRSQGQHRGWFSWRRQAFRWLLKSAA